MSSMISRERKLVFVHVPKTAGASITYTLRDLFEDGWPEEPHLTLWDLAGDHRGYFSFMVARNPWAMCASWHRWHVHHGDHNKTMDVAVRKLLPQTHYGLAHVTRVLRFESLEEEFAELCREIGAGERELMRLNASEAGDYRQLYTDETRQIVAERFAVEIERFGYEF